jgi:hypothetical protein
VYFIGEVIGWIGDVNHDIGVQVEKVDRMLPIGRRNQNQVFRARRPNAVDGGLSSCQPGLSSHSGANRFVHQSEHHVRIVDVMSRHLCPEVSEHRIRLTTGHTNSGVVIGTIIVRVGDHIHFLRSCIGYHRIKASQFSSI